MFTPDSAARSNAWRQFSLNFEVPSLQSSKVLSKSIAIKSNRRIELPPITENGGRRLSALDDKEMPP
jgi:hypothetical protein